MLCLFGTCQLLHLLWTHVSQYVGYLIWLVGSSTQQLIFFTTFGELISRLGLSFGVAGSICLVRNVGTESCQKTAINDHLVWNIQNAVNASDCRRLMHAKSSMFFMFVTDIILLVCQVHHHVLADQREPLLDHVLASISSNRQSLENAVSTKDVDKLWSRINGVSCTLCYVSFSVQSKCTLHAHIVIKIMDF